jgi:hypothetical protein
MKNPTAALIVAAAGLAAGAPALAQFGLVTDQPGSFTDISATGAAIAATGDDSSVSFLSSVTNALAQNATMYASTNGLLSAGSYSAYTNLALPVGSQPFLICAYWDDLFVDGPAVIKHQGLVENGVNVEVVQWNQVRLLGGSARGNFQVKLFASGPIVAQLVYQDMTWANNGAGATVGIQWDSASSNQYSYNTGGALTGPRVISVMPLPTGGCCRSNGLCALLDANTCASQGGAFQGVGSTCANANCPSGACCLPSLSCVISNSTGCASQGGTYRGDGSVCATANCPQPGACCTPNGTCSQVNGPSCTAGGGTYRGDNTSCASANCPQPPPPTLGPDVYVGDIIDVNCYGSVGGVMAYAVGTNACNAGDAPVQWTQSNNQHPVIAQNLFRLKGGRFEQLGQSWLKHGFSSTNSNFCGTCQQPPGGGSQLGPACSDAYGSSLNGGQTYLGPRSDVNATTGSYPYPYTISYQQTGDAIFKRLQVPVADVTPAQNTGAVYIAEAHYVTADDAQWNNGLNNCSWRQISINGASGQQPAAGPTYVKKNAMEAWKQLDPAVTLSNADYTDTSIQNRTITARFTVGGKATSNGDGTWHYEYNLYNHNSSRAAGTFTIPLGPGATLTNAGFRAPAYHSGEPYSNAPWTPAVEASGVTFSTAPYASNPNANAVRWGTMYTYRFDSNLGPAQGAATIGLFTPGTPTALTAAGLPVPSIPACYPNCDGSSEGPSLNVSDFTCFVNRFSSGDMYTNCDGSTTHPVLNVGDFTCFVSRYAGGCP